MSSKGIFKAAITDAKSKLINRYIGCWIFEYTPLVTRPLACGVTANAFPICTRLIIKKVNENRAAAIDIENRRVCSAEKAAKVRQQTTTLNRILKIVFFISVIICTLSLNFGLKNTD
jgi:hypothetical protein